MASAELPDERGTRSVAGHRLGGGRDQSRRKTRSSTVRPGPVDVGQGGAMPSLTINRPAGDVESPATAHETAIAAAEAAGDTESVSGLRRMACAEEQDRQTLDRLIENLRMRFPVRAP